MWWIRTSRLSIKNSLFDETLGREEGGQWRMDTTFRLPRVRGRPPVPISLPLPLPLPLRPGLRLCSCLCRVAVLLAWLCRSQLGWVALSARIEAPDPPGPCQSRPSAPSLSVRSLRPVCCRQRGAGVRVKARVRVRARVEVRARVRVRMWGTTGCSAGIFSFGLQDAATLATSPGGCQSASAVRRMWHI